MLKMKKQVLMSVMLILLFNTIFATAQEEPTASSVASSDCIVKYCSRSIQKEQMFTKQEQGGSNGWWS